MWVVRQDLRNCLATRGDERVFSPFLGGARCVYRSACHALESRSRLSGVHEILVDVRAFGGRPFLFAGVVRDTLYSSLTGVPAIPRDYDVGVAQMSSECFVAFASSRGAARNRYGGYQFNARDGLNVDLWRIEDTVGVLAASCKPTVTNVLRSFVIDLNAIAYDPADSVIHDEGCLPALVKREIGVVRGAIMHDHANFAGRALALKSRFDFRLSKELQDLVAHWSGSAEAERQIAKASAFGYSPEFRSGSATTALVGICPECAQSI